MLLESYRVRDAHQYETDLISFIKKELGITQNSIADLLNAKLDRRITPATITRWKQSSNVPEDMRFRVIDRIPPEVQIILLKKAKLFWPACKDARYDESDYDIENEEIYSRDFRGRYGFRRNFNTYFDIPWNLIVRSESNQAKWYKYFEQKIKSFPDYRKRESSHNDIYELTRKFVLFLNHVGFNFPYQFDEFKENKVLIKFLDDWIDETISLYMWFHKYVPQEDGLESRSPYGLELRKFYEEKIHQIAFAYVVQNFDNSAYTHYYDLRYELEIISNISIDFYRTCVFINSISSKQIPKEKFSQILVANCMSLHLDLIDLKDTPNSTVDTSSWSSVDQEIYKKLNEISSKLN